MKPQPAKPVLTRQDGDNLAISGDALLVLMQDVLARGAAFRFHAKGWSMSPFIEDGDAITITSVAKAKPAIGKVVAFIQPVSGQLVVHRVIGRQGAAFLIRGDHTAAQPDGLISPAQILGCVTRVERDGRRVLLGLGLERYMVAALSRHGKLGMLLSRVCALKGEKS